MGHDGPGGRFVARLSMAQLWKSYPIDDPMPPTAGVTLQPQHSTARHGTAQHSTALQNQPPLCTWWMVHTMVRCMEATLRVTRMTTAAAWPSRPGGRQEGWRLHRHLRFPDHGRAAG